MLGLIVNWGFLENRFSKSVLWLILCRLPVMSFKPLQFIWFPLLLHSGRLFWLSNNINVRLRIIVAHYQQNLFIRFSPNFHQFRGFRVVSIPFPLLQWPNICLQISVYVPTSFYLYRFFEPWRSEWSNLFSISRPCEFIAIRLGSGWWICQGYYRLCCCECPES